VASDLCTVLFSCTGFESQVAMMEKTKWEAFSSPIVQVTSADAITTLDRRKIGHYVAIASKSK
jgi:hypothetical protein